MAALTGIAYLFLSSITTKPFCVIRGGFFRKIQHSCVLTIQSRANTIVGDALNGAHSRRALTKIFNFFLLKRGAIRRFLSTNNYSWIRTNPLFSNYNLTTVLGGNPIWCVVVLAQYSFRAIIPRVVFSTYQKKYMCVYYKPCSQ